MGLVVAGTTGVVVLVVVAGTTGVVTAGGVTVPGGLILIPGVEDNAPVVSNVGNMLCRSVLVKPCVLR